MESAADGEISTESRPKRGRPRNRPETPPKQAHEIDPDVVEQMIEDGCSVEIVADHLGTTWDIIDNNFKPEIVRGRATRKWTLLQEQYKLAKKGNPTMLIWLGKQELEQADRQVVSNEYEEYEIIIGPAKEADPDRLPPSGAGDILELPSTT